MTAVAQIGDHCRPAVGRRRPRGYGIVGPHSPRA